MSHATRETENRAYQASLRERKRLRRARAEIHAALQEAGRMARSRKRGTSKVVAANMETIGYRVRDLSAPDVLGKFYPPSK